jgi:hypothetical protein
MLFGGMSVKKLSFALLAGAGAISAFPADAAQFSTTYTSTSGTAMAAALTITTADVLNSVGGYNILAVSGNVNGDAITGLIPTANPPASQVSASHLWNVNNVYYDQPRFLNSDGMLFSTASGLEYNMWGNSPVSFELASGYQSSPGTWAYGASSGGYVGATAPVFPPAVPLASYSFGGSLAANEPGVQALAEINPAGTNGFLNDGVFGVQQQVYEFNTLAGGGLTFDNSSQLFPDDSYSVTMTVMFTDLHRSGQVTSLVEGRTADGGGVIVADSHPDTDPSRFQFGGGSTPSTSAIFGENRWHNIAVTVSGNYGCIYQDGVSVNCANASELAITNPASLLKFFTPHNIFNSATGRVAALSIYSGMLSAQQGEALTALPSPTPEPAVWALMAGGFGLVGGALRRRKSALRFG